MRDYQAWHDAYEDPASDLSWRLRTVRRRLDEDLDRRSGPVRVLSLCSGDGRDLVGVLAGREDRGRVTGLLVELHPQIADDARRAVAEAGLTDRLEVRTADAAAPASFADAVPADLILLVGIFGNISDADLWRTIDAAPGFCAPGATLLWSRGRRSRGDLNDEVRARFTAAGFTELAYDALDQEDRPALGTVRYDGAPRAVPSAPLFTFVR